MNKHKMPLDIESFKKNSPHAEKLKEAVNQLIPDFLKVPDEKEIQNVEGEYFSTNGFVTANGLEKIAEEVLGKDWEPEDDVNQILEIIEHMNIGRYSVVCSEYDTREEDIIVTKLPDNRYFLFGEEALDLLEQGRVNEIAETGYYDLFEWIEGVSKPEEILFAFDGWKQFSTITQDEYNIIKNDQYNIMKN